MNIYIYNAFQNLHIEIQTFSQARFQLLFTIAWSTFPSSWSPRFGGEFSMGMVGGSRFTLLKIKNVLKLSCHWLVTFLEKTSANLREWSHFSKHVFFPDVSWVCLTVLHSPWQDYKSGREQNPPTPPPPKKKKNYKHKSFIIPAFLPKRKSIRII